MVHNNGNETMLNLLFNKENFHLVSSTFIECYTVTACDVKRNTSWLEYHAVTPTIQKQDVSNYSIVRRMFLCYWGMERIPNYVMLFQLTYTEHPA